MRHFIRRLLGDFAISVSVGHVNCGEIILRLVVIERIVHTENRCRQAPSHQCERKDEEHYPDFGAAHRLHFRNSAMNRKSRQRCSRCPSIRATQPITISSRSKNDR